MPIVMMPLLLGLASDAPERVVLNTLDLADWPKVRLPIATSLLD